MNGVYQIVSVSEGAYETRRFNEGIQIYTYILEIKIIWTGRFILDQSDQIRHRPLSPINHLQFTETSEFCL